MWNTDPRTYQLGQDPIHLCMPVLLGLHSQGHKGYGIFFDSPFRGWFDLGADEIPRSSPLELN
jgi:alpha-glucosidase (family GH31 glycosyl hydrolase)